MQEICLVYVVVVIFYDWLDWHSFRLQDVGLSFWGFFQKQIVKCQNDCKNSINGQLIWIIKLKKCLKFSLATDLTRVRRQFGL